MRIILCYVRPNPQRERKPYHFFLEKTIECLLTLNFPAENIILIAHHKKDVKQFQKKYGIQGLQGPSIPSHWDSVNIEKSKHLFFYKPLCLYYCLPEPTQEITVLADMDIMYYTNPIKWLDTMSDDIDIAVNEGKLYTDKMPVDLLTENDWATYATAVHSPSFAELLWYAKYQLKLDIPYPKRTISIGSNFVAIKPHAHKKFVADWYKWSDILLSNHINIKTDEQPMVMSMLENNFQWEINHREDILYHFLHKHAKKVFHQKFGNYLA